MDDIGRELSEIRTAKGLSLKDISDLTRIDAKFLEKIEKNEFDFMPAIYVKAFLKEYVSALGLDERSYLERLNQILNPPIKRIHLESKLADESSTEKEEKVVLKKVEDEIKARKKTLPLKFKSTISVLVIFLLFLIFIFFPSIKNKISEYEQQSSELTKPELSKQSEVKANINEQLPILKKDSLVLTATSTDKVWIQVKSDGKTIEEVLLMIGDKRTWFAKDNFELIVGSVGALNLKLNGKEIPLAGGLGAVRKIKISSNKVEVLKTVSQKN